MLLKTASYLCLCLFSNDDTVHRDEIVDIDKYRASVAEASPASIHEVNDSTAVAIEYLKIRDAVREDRIGVRGDHFLGFLSGRLRVTPPTWWSDEFRNGIIHANRTSSFFSRLPEGPWSTNEEGLRFGGVSDTTIRGNLLELRKGEATVSLNRKDFEAWLTGEREAWADTEEDSDGAIAATIQGDSFAVAFECAVSGVRQPSRLFFGDARTGKPVWNARLTNVLEHGQYSGSFKGVFTEIMIDDKRVILFGSHSVGMSFQIYDKATGECTTFFSTALLSKVQMKPSPKAK